VLTHSVSYACWLVAWACCICTATHMATRQQLHGSVLLLSPLLDRPNYSEQAGL
jgi:hypothetical protein